MKSRLKESTKRLKYACMKPEGKSKWSPPKKNKAATTKTKRTRLENNLRRQKLGCEQLRKPFIRNFALYTQVLYVRQARVNDQTHVCII